MRALTRVLLALRLLCISFIVSFFCDIEHLLQACKVQRRGRNSVITLLKTTCFAGNSPLVPSLYIGAGLARVHWSNISKKDLKGFPCLFFWTILFTIQSKQIAKSEKTHGGINNHIYFHKNNNILTKFKRLLWKILNVFLTYKNDSALNTIWQPSFRTWPQKLLFLITIQNIPKYNSKITKSEHKTTKWEKIHFGWVLEKKTKLIYLCFSQTT